MRLGFFWISGFMLLYFCIQYASISHGWEQEHGGDGGIIDGVIGFKGWKRFKSQHVPSKIHVQNKKHLIPIKEKVKRPQKPKLKKSKMMWIPKMLIKEMNLKEKSLLASIHATQKASSIHPSSKSPYKHPSSPQSTFSPYASYPKFPILHLPTLLLVLIFLFLHFLLNLAQNHLSHYFITSQGVCQ